MDIIIIILTAVLVGEVVVLLGLTRKSVREECRFIREQDQKDRLAASSVSVRTRQS